MGVDKSLFPVTFSHGDWKHLGRFSRKMPTKPYAMSNLDKPFEMWSEREKVAVRKGIFRSPDCDLKATLCTGRLVVNDSKPSSSSSSKSAGNTTVTTKHLYENDVRTLKSLKFMFESNDIHWSKLRFKIHPSQWNA